MLGVRPEEVCDDDHRQPEQSAPNAVGFQGAAICQPLHQLHPQAQAQDAKAQQHPQPKVPIYEKGNREQRQKNQQRNGLSLILLHRISPS